jgi:hypothetical protein
MRVLLIVSGATALICLTMTHAGMILALPRPYAILQFSYRLESYVLLGVSGAVLAILVLAQSGPRTRGVRLLTGILPIILGVAVIGAVQQVSATPTGGDRGAAVRSYLETPPAGERLNDYIDVHDLPIMGGSELRPEVDFPPATVHGNRVSRVVSLPARQQVDTNLGGGPDLVHVTGARVVGVNKRTANYVLEIAPHAGATETISLSPADSLPVVLGRLLTLIAVIVLAVELVAIAVGRRRAGRA